LTKGKKAFTYPFTYPSKGKKAFTYPLTKGKKAFTYPYPLSFLSSMILK
jgi:hypothetical protein